MAVDITNKDIRVFQYYFDEFDSSLPDLYVFRLCQGFYTTLLLI